jgi:chromosome partitioning protein
VGKTTVSINMAHAFARAGLETLLVDADPQGSVGLSLTRQSRMLSGFYDYSPTRASRWSGCWCRPVGDVHLVRQRPSQRLRSRRCADRAPSRAGPRLPAGVEARGFDLCLIDTPAGLFG